MNKQHATLAGVQVWYDEAWYRLTPVITGAEDAMRGHYNQTYQGKPSRGDKVFSTGRFIQGILDIRVTQKIDTNSTVWYVHSRVVVCSLLLFNDLVLTDSENRNVCSFLVCTVDKASKH